MDVSVFLGRDDPRRPALGIYGTDPRGTASVALGRRCELIVAGMVRKAEELLARAV